MRRTRQHGFVGVVASVVLAIVFAVAMSLCACSGSNEGGTTVAESAKNVKGVGLADGEYQVSVDLEGGTGRASVTSPTKLDVREGNAVLTVEWSSPNYDYMVVAGERYLPVNQGGNSVFEIPVPALGEPFDVVADTTAMSTPHEITYTLTVNRS